MPIQQYEFLFAEFFVSVCVGPKLTPMEKLLQAHNIAQPSQNRGTVNVDGQPYRVDAYVNGNYIGSLSETFPRSISLDWAAGEYERIGGTDVGGTIAYLTNLRAAYPSVRLEVVSDAFQQVAGLAGPFNTIITTGDLPISVTFNGIDTVTYEREAIGSPGYKYAEYKLLAQVRSAKRSSTDGA